MTLLRYVIKELDPNHKPPMKNCTIPWAKNVLKLALYYISFGHLIICSLHSLSSPFYPILSKIKNKKPLLPFLVSSGTLTIQKYKWSKKLPHWQTTFAPEHLLLTPVSYVHIHGTFGTLYYIGPTQVKCRLLISSIFYVMNLQHIFEMLEFNL